MMSEIWGVFFGGLSVLVMASLVSYEPKDLLPTAGVTHDVINWVGPGGAQMAQFYLTFLGSAHLVCLYLQDTWRGLCFKPRVVELNWVRGIGAHTDGLLQRRHSYTWAQRAELMFPIPSAAWSVCSWAVS